jgi:tRNA threonylcarbamoyladenosine biosynthesis protein TsaB
MLILGIDTTSSKGSAALVEDGRLIANVEVDTPATHSERLLPAVDFLLRQAGTALRDIQVYAVVAGPGSFTGVRIGLATVKGLSFSTGTPVVALSSLETVAYGIRDKAKILWPILDAKRGEVYTAVYESPGGDGIPRPLTDPIVSPPEEAFRLTSRPGVAIAGSGAELYAHLFEKIYPHSFELVTTDGFLAPDAAKLACLYAREGKALAPEAFDANYVRHSEAEVKRKARKEK